MSGVSPAVLLQVSLVAARPRRPRAGRAGGVSLSISSAGTRARVWPSSLSLRLSQAGAGAAAQAAPPPRRRRRRGGVSDSDTRPGAAAAAVVGTVTVADPTVAGQHKTKDLTHKTKDSSSSHVKLTHCPATPAVSVTPGPLNRCDLKLE